MKLYLYLSFFTNFLTLFLGSHSSVHFHSSQAVKHGLVYPPDIYIQPEHDVMVSMLKSLINQERCLLRTPEFIDIDLAENNNERYEKWGSGCGARIKNIQKSDEGRWQLISIKGDKNLQGIFTIILQDPNAIHQDNIFDYVEGDPLGQINFLKPHSQYCTIQHARSGEPMVVHGDCIYPVAKVDRKLQGKWKLGVGMAGSIEEIPVEKEVIVRIEDLDIGFVEDGNNKVVHVFCNLKNSLKSIQFCRFERIQDKKAFNLNDGLGKGRYSYYGRGIYMNDCGLSILDPTDLDYGSWRCTVGVTKNDDKTSAVMRGAMLVKRSASRYIMASKDNPQPVILAVEGKELTVVCNAPVSIIYCSLMHPDGTLIAPNKDNDTYHFNTGNLNIGRCELTVFEAKLTDSGDWTCYMGAKQAGLEMKETVTVKVAGALAAVQRELRAYKNESVTLHCLTAGASEELRYCRFITPDGIPFHIDETITAENAIQGEFYYPETSHLYAGDCAVTVTHLRTPHFGKWTCLAMIKSEDIEYMDTITLIALSDTNTLSTASATGIGVGVSLVVIVALMGVVMWKRQSLPRWLRRRPGRDTEAELQQPRFSGESGESVVHLNINPTGQPIYGGAPRSAPVQPIELQNL